MSILYEGRSVSPAIDARLAIYNGPTGVFIGPLFTKPLKPGEIRGKVLAAGVCQADIRFVRGGKKVHGADYICVLGHDAVAKIESVSKSARKAGFRPGQVVAIKPHIVPDSQKGRKAWKNGEIFRLDTRHLGMNAFGLGVFAHHVTLPMDNFTIVPPAVLHAIKPMAKGLGLHWSAPLAELEHLACVQQGFQSIMEAEEAERGENSLVEKLTFDGGNVLIAGAGWLAYLWLIYLSQQFPTARFCLTEPNLARWRAFKRAANMWEAAPELLSHAVDENPRRGTFDLVISANASPQSAADLLKWVRPGGHISLFSGIDGAEDNPVFDGTGFVDLERVHRKGGWTWLHLSDNPVGPKALASGSSGYSNETFDAAVAQVPRFYRQMGCGITGLVLGLTANQILVHPNHAGMDGYGSTPYASPKGLEWPALVDIFADSNLPGRSSHLKIVAHPWGHQSVFRSSYR